MVQECYKLYWTNPGSNIPQNSSCMATYLPTLKPSKWDKEDMQDIAGEAKMNSYAMFFCEPLHTDIQVLADLQKLIYYSSVWTQDLFWRTYQKWWMIEMKRESGKTVWAVNDGNNYLGIITWTKRKFCKSMNLLQVCHLNKKYFKNSLK